MRFRRFIKKQIDINIKDINSLGKRLSALEKRNEELEKWQNHILTKPPIANPGDIVYGYTVIAIKKHTVDYYFNYETTKLKTYLYEVRDNCGIISEISEQELEGLKKREEAQIATMVGEIMDEENNHKSHKDEHKKSTETELVEKADGENLSIKQEQ